MNNNNSEFQLNAQMEGQFIEGGKAQPPSSNVTPSSPALSASLQPTAQQVSGVVNQLPDSALHHTAPSSFPTTRRSSVTLLTKPDPIITTFAQEVVKLNREEDNTRLVAGVEALLQGFPEEHRLRALKEALIEVLMASTSNESANGRLIETLLEKGAQLTQTDRDRMEISQICPYALETIVTHNILDIYRKDPAPSNEEIEEQFKLIKQFGCGYFRTKHFLSQKHARRRLRIFLKCFLWTYEPKRPEAVLWGM